VCSTMAAITSPLHARRVWGSTEGACAEAGASSAGTREARPSRSTRRSESWTGGEGGGRIAAHVAVVLVLLSGVSRAACLVAASYRSPPIGVASYAGSRSGPLSDPLEAHRYRHQSLSLGRSVARRVVLGPKQRSGLRPSAPAPVEAGGRPPRTLSAARATEHRPSRTPSPGGGRLGSFRAAFAENAPRLGVYLLVPGIGRGVRFRYADEDGQRSMPGTATDKERQRWKGSTSG